MKDLFGQEAQKYKHPQAYAASPGYGPKGMFCKDCDHYCRVEYHDKIYRKCGLIRENWTHGEGTDILASMQSCTLFVEKEREAMGDKGK